MMTEKKTPPLQILLITGMSGAGKSSALKILEDLGYEAIDNLPISLLPDVIKLTQSDTDQIRPALAIGIDVRTRNFQPDQIFEQISDLRDKTNIDVKLIFLDSSNLVISQRFTETRRRHPLALDRPVNDGIVRERQMMESIRAEADFIFDTSELSIHELRRMFAQRFERQHTGNLSVSISSFGYPRGLPRDADLVFDVRFLRNPHYVGELRPLDGRDDRVCSYVQEDDAFPGFWEKISSLLLTLLPEYEKEGKSYLTIAFGCTGGKHRSVCVAERMTGFLDEHGFLVNLNHRELSD